MKKIIIGIHILILVLFSMCTSPKQKVGESLPVFDVADALNAALPDTFTWNSIAKNVRMIPLKVVFPLEIDKTFPPKVTENLIFYIHG